ncbi:MAG: MCE family protein [Candidatus Gastranaerophilales bacterium]|nr:MCE family protein [Candidatus Gastranaerophilales bacterium]
MEKKQKYTSALKVGILTLSAISILIFTVLWVKGRSLSGGERIDIAFKDVNGMRAGSAVQMMGLRIGQVEDITPIMQGKDSYVKLRFVVTEKGVKIPLASTISIQQSGIIGEQFLEVTPPKIELLYVETSKNETSVKKDDDIYMELSKGIVPVGKIIDASVLKTSQLPFEARQKINTKNALQISYYIDLPGLVLDNDLLGIKIKDNKTMLYLPDGEIPETPNSDLKYTVIEPMRLSDFMNLGFRATRAMLDTNDRINEILSDEFIADMKTSVENIRDLTKSANTTLDKASKLIDTSKNEIEGLIKESQELIDSLTQLSNNLNAIISDETLKKDIVSGIKSVGKMSDNINKILEDAQTKEIISDINECMRNLSDITNYINEYTKDEKLKEDITSTVTNLSNITKNISNIMDDYNKLEDSEKLKLRSTVKDVLTITKNVKKFSEKLNKRFLLFRLMF